VIRARIDTRARPHEVSISGRRVACSAADATRLRETVDFLQPTRIAATAGGTLDFDLILRCSRWQDEMSAKKSKNSVDTRLRIQVKGDFTLGTEGN
jgi:hypothetical protein